MARTDIALRGFENRVHITVTVTTEFKVRLWIATQMLRLAARILQATIEIR